MIRTSMQDSQAFIDHCNALTSGQSLPEILQRVIQLLSDETKWCQGAFAMSADGQRVKAGSPEAVAWSIEGAVGVCSNEYGVIPPNILKYLDQLVFGLTGKDETVGWYNDRSTHENMLRFLHEALRRSNG